MSAERTVARNTAWLVLQPLLMNVLSLAATAYISRRLGVTEFGRFNFGLAFVAMFAPLTNMGIRSLAIRRVAQNRESAPDYLGQVLVLRLLLTLGSILVVVAALPLLGPVSGDTRLVILISALGMLLTTGVQVLTDGFQAFEVVRPVTLAQFLGGLLLTAASVVVLKLGGGLRELALAYALGPLISLVLLALWARRQPFQPRLIWDTAVFRQMLREASPFLAIILIEVVSARVDVVVVRRLLGDTRLGCYTAAQMLVDRATVLIDGAATALLPAIAHLSARNRPEAIQLIRKAALWLLLLSLPIAAMTTALAPLIVKLVFGRQYAAAGVILAVGMWRLPAMCLAVLAANALFAVGRQDLELRTGSISMIVSLFLIYPLVRFWGPVGGALALTIRYLVAFGLRLPELRRTLPGLWPLAQWARLAAALALMAVPLASISGATLDLRVMLLAFYSAALYLLSLALMRILPVEPLVNRLCRKPDRPGAPLVWATEETGGRDR
jgi:PST family polysaccharide transporter